MEAIKLKRIVIKEELFAITNDTIESIILGQFIYWQERVKDYDLFLKEEEKRCLDNNEPFNVNMSNGWIYKKSSDLINECMLSVSENTVRRYINNLEEKGFISSRKNPNIKWDKTLQYRVNIVYIVSKLKEIGYQDVDFDFINNNTYKSYKDQLKDKRWKKLANKIRKRDNYTCQKCGSHKHLQVHHKKYIKGRLAWEYDESNLVTLCSECHKEIHNIK